jgi:hypothetical protein
MILTEHRLGTNKQQKSAMVLTSAAVVLIKYGNNDDAVNSDHVLKS